MSPYVSAIETADFVEKRRCRHVAVYVWWYLLAHVIVPQTGKVQMKCNAPLWSCRAHKIPTTQWAAAGWWLMRWRAIYTPTALTMSPSWHAVIGMMCILSEPFPSPKPYPTRYAMVRRASPLERARELNKYPIKWLGDLWLDVLVFFEGLCDPSKFCPAEPLQGIWWQSHTATDLKLNFLNPLASIIWPVINRTKERWISQ